MNRQRVAAEVLSSPSVQPGFVGLGSQSLECAQLSALNFENPQVGILLKNARRRTGMTQRQLSDLSAVSVRTIRDLELERTKNPRIQTLRLLADALQLSKVRRAELEVAATSATAEPLIDRLPLPSVPLGPIVGRVREVGALAALAESSGHRLVKVVGVPGVGKTRLIHEVAANLHRSGRLPAICLDASDSSPTDRTGTDRTGIVISHVAAILGCAATVDDLAAVIRNSDLLLAVDGRVLGPDDEAAIRVLLRQCPGLRVLYETSEAVPTSPDPVFSVVPLSVLDWSLGPGQSIPRVVEAGPAVEFLRLRCPQLAAGQTNDAELDAALAGICWYLDGIPAALAAVGAWLEIYDPTQLRAIAATEPIMLTSILSGVPVNSEDSLIGWLRHTVASLPGPTAVALRRLAGAGSWTADQALELIGGPADGAYQAIHALLALGLVRRIEAGDRGCAQFVVLNLVRHMLTVGADATEGSRGLSDALESRTDPDQPRWNDRGYAQQMSDLSGGR